MTDHAHQHPITPETNGKGGLRVMQWALGIALPVLFAFGVSVETRIDSLAESRAMRQEKLINIEKSVQRIETSHLEAIQILARALEAAHECPAGSSR